MIKKSFHTFFILFLIYTILNDVHVQTIIYGISLFIVGMFFLEIGFKKLTGGKFENVIKKTTSSSPASIITGTLTTAILQSSSLVSLILMSFLSAKIITLTQSVAVILGSNIGTTMSAWIIATIGMKVSISAFAIPLLIAGLAIKVLLNKGIGEVFMGMAFVFIGIDEMKTGFSFLKDTIDLSQYMMPGFIGVLTFVLVGIVITVIIPSSAAVLALIITALSANQITLEAAFAMTIGSNIGTTITTLMGALSSSIDAKRMALGHLLFNLTIGIFFIALFYPIIYAKDYLLDFYQLSYSETYQLVAYHTMFNLIGVILFYPFLKKFVELLKKIIKYKSTQTKPKYLNNTILEVPSAAIVSLNKELENLYKKLRQSLLTSFNLDKSDIFDVKDISTLTTRPIFISQKAEVLYKQKIQLIYGKILKYTSLVQNKDLTQTQQEDLQDIKQTTSLMIEIYKEVKVIQENIIKYRNNADMAAEYDFIRYEMLTTLKTIEKIRKDKGDGAKILNKIEDLKEKLKDIDSDIDAKLNKYIKDASLSINEITVIINDLNATKAIVKKLMKISKKIWIKERELKNEED